jgi:hypothetical protein
MWLRHADSEVTANIYTHIKENFTSDVPECLQNVFEPTQRPKATVLKTDFGYGKMQ